MQLTIYQALVSVSPHSRGVFSVPITGNALTSTCSSAVQSGPPHEPHRSRLTESSSTHFDFSRVIRYRVPPRQMNARETRAHFVYHSSRSSVVRARRLISAASDTPLRQVSSRTKLHQRQSPASYCVEFQVTDYRQDAPSE